MGRVRTSGVGWPGETIEQFKARLKKSGYWNQYVKVRQKMAEDNKITPTNAHKFVWQMFPPVEWEDLVADLKASPAGAGRSGGESGLHEFKSKGRGVSEREIVRWVFDNIMRKDVDYDDAPCPGAWWLLTQIRENKSNAWQFIMHVWGKMAIQKVEEGASAERFTDPGTSQLELIEQIENAILSSGAEGSAGEPGVPAADDPVGVEQQGEGAGALDDLRA